MEEELYTSFVQRKSLIGKFMSPNSNLEALRAEKESLKHFSENWWTASVRENLGKEADAICSFRLRYYLSQPHGSLCSDLAKNPVRFVLSRTPSTTDCTFEERLRNRLGYFQWPNWCKPKIVPISGISANVLYTISRKRHEDFAAHHFRSSWNLSTQGAGSNYRVWRHMRWSCNSRQKV